MQYSVYHFTFLTHAGFDQLTLVTNLLNKNTNWIRLILLKLNTFMYLCLIFLSLQSFWNEKKSEMYDGTALGNHLKIALVELRFSNTELQTF